MIGFVRVVLAMLAVHLGLGLLFAAAFQLRGLPALDPAARGAGLGFRVLITPGLIALWPWIGMRWLRSMRGDAVSGSRDAIHAPRRLRSAHGLLWKTLAVVIPIGIAAAIWHRPGANPSRRSEPLIPRAQPAPGLNPGR